MKKDRKTKFPSKGPDEVSLRELVLSGAVWWIESYPTMRRMIDTDPELKKFLKPRKVGTGHKTRFFIKKKDVQKYIQERYKKAAALPAGWDGD